MSKSTSSGFCFSNALACAITTPRPPCCQCCYSLSRSSNSTDCVRPPSCGTKSQLVVQKFGPLRQAYRWSGRYGLGSCHEHPDAGQPEAGYIGYPKGSMKFTDGNLLARTCLSAALLTWLANHVALMTALPRSLSTSARGSSRQRAPQQKTLDLAHIFVKYVFSRRRLFVNITLESESAFGHLGNAYDRYV